ncbi:pyruvate kinase [Sodalis-like secondary symbiont of Drepanosiphum platanoidis]|uniref:pyruvate kinase n=1 Tax=Sodalis-like secondary symbiont of Drepanosiphum platanoidis TaxID=2994493 RepID=UPI003463F436
MKKEIRKTKIIATLGPSSDKKNNLEKIIISGINAVRLNFSHGNYKDHILRAKKVRFIAKKLKKYISIIGDLQGPKIRLSTFYKKKIFLISGKKFILDSRIKPKKGTEKIVGIDYKNLPNDILPGDILLLDDGKIQLKTLKTNKKYIVTKVIVGGEISDNKGINKLGGGLSAKSLTKKDKKDILLAAKIKVDYLAISFPRTGDDIKYAKKLLYKAGSNAKIIAKIERAEAVSSKKSMDDIISSSDVIMVARGDLAIEIGDSELARVQKEIIFRAKKYNKIVITATQMMESMIKNPIPTRAEVMDISNAVLDGSDAVMLSAETASGKYPVETVRAMSNICKGSEKIYKNKFKNCLKKNIKDFQKIFILSIAYTTNYLNKISSIIITVSSKKIIRIISNISLNIPIFVLSNNKYLLNIITLYRGVIPIFFNKKINDLKSLNKSLFFLKKEKYLFTGDLSIIIRNEKLENIKKNFYNINIINID